MRDAYLDCVTMIDRAAAELRLAAEIEWSWQPADWTPDAALTATALCEIELAGDFAIGVAVADPPPLAVSYEEETGFAPDMSPASDFTVAVDAVDDAALTAIAEMFAPAVPMVRPPAPEAASPPVRTRQAPAYGAMAGLISFALAASLGWHFATRPGAVCRAADAGGIGIAARIAATVMAARIVTAESGGDAAAKNPRSSATGAGQFLDGTWLDMIRAHRPDLTARSRSEILALRYDAELSREMVARFAEANAALLKRRCLPVTAATLYLAHFAGGAGAAAVLTAPDDADAATTMAEADASGRTTRDKIVTANPFLDGFTVADLKVWADRKMRAAAGPRLSRM